MRASASSPPAQQQEHEDDHARVVKWGSAQADLPRRATR